MSDDDSLTVNVAAPADSVWRLIETEFERTGGNGETLIERLPEMAVSMNADSRMADLILMDHPNLDGGVRLILSGPPDAPFLTVECEWTDRETGDSAGVNDLARQIVLTLKSRAESEG